MAGFDHIRWIGGGTGAGKTTVARQLAEQSGLSIYSTDAAIRLHASKLTVTDEPLLESFRRMDMDERWVIRQPDQMYQTFPWFHGVGFNHLIADLRLLPTNTISIVEGFRLLPRLVHPLLSERNHAVWLIPTPSFREAAFAARRESEAFWERTRDPQRALSNLLARDKLFTDQLDADAKRFGLPTLAIDGEKSASAIVTAVAQQFAI